MASTISAILDATASSPLSTATASGSGADDSVENLAFRINDIDWGDGNHLDIVTVNAYGSSLCRLRTSLSRTVSDELNAAL